MKDFYLSMLTEVTQSDARELFEQLAKIEDIHKDRIFEEYQRITGLSDRSSFENQVMSNFLEGGLTTEEYINRFQPDLDSVIDIVSLAMSIEAQALDLYSRGIQFTSDTACEKIFRKIADEEKVHLQKLGSLLDNFTEVKNE